MSNDLSKTIWFETQQRENVFARARRRFVLPSRPERAELRVTCSGRYRLWINGAAAGRGPAHGGVRKRRYDTLDVTELLRAGGNVIAVQTIHFGYHMAYTPAGDAALWLELECDGAVALTTDEAWRFSVDPCFDPTSARRNGSYGIQEIYDARQEETWQTDGYDDGAWSPAVFCSRLRDGRLPWEALIPRGVPQCRESSILPRAVARVGEVLSQEFEPRMFRGTALASVGVFLMSDVVEAPRLTRIDNAEALVEGGSGHAVVSQPSPLDHAQVEQYCATLILDFGREIDAYGWIDVEGNAGAVVDVAYSEQLNAGRVQAVRQNAHYADRYILREGRQRHEVYDWKGYRYVQLTFRELTRPLIIHGAGATFTSYPVEPRGAFACSDSRVTDTWRVGAYTQQLCMQDRMMDCPWREQQQWLGDGRVQLLIIQNAFGARDMPRKFIEDFAHSQFDDGLFPSISNGGGCIFDYALWWLVGLKDTCLFNNDPSLARDVLPNAVRLLEKCVAHTNAAGLLEETPYKTFIDWANVGKAGVVAPMNAIYHIALSAMAETAEWIGETAVAAQCRARAEAVAAVYHTTFWNEARGLYIDNVADGQQSASFSQHTQAITALAGLARGDVRALLRKTLDEPGLVQTEPYFSFYLVEALARNGLAADALAFLRRRWGAMLDQGATTFWEEWQRNGTFRGGRWTPRPRSHCHAWSAAPTAWLSRYVLGVRVEQYGGPIIIEPNPCGLAEASGVVPTAYGPVAIQWRAQGGRLAVDAAVPAGVSTQTREPAGYEGATTFTATCSSSK